MAILAVVLFHSGVRWMPGGFSGVDIFFAISGYLIGGHIYGDLQRGTFRYANFYKRRAKRILPPLFVMLAVLLVVCGWLFSPYELRGVGSSAAAAVASVSNILFSRGAGYFAARSEDNPLLMTWSLGVEEQFYLVVPLLLVWVCRLRPRLVPPAIALVTAVSFGFAWWELGANPMGAFYLLPSRAWELALGVGLAILEAKAARLTLHERGWKAEGLGSVGLVLVVAPLGMLRSTTPFPGPAALASVVGCVLLLAARGSWVNRRVLSLQPLVFVGRVSYSWYLWHWPLLALLRTIRGGALPLGWGLAAITVAFGLAVLSFYFVERPFRSSRLAAGPLLWRYGAVSALFLVVSVVVWRTDGLPGRYPGVAKIDAVKREQEMDICLAGPGESVPRVACGGFGSPQMQVALWGDSHAAALAPALREAVARAGYGLEVYAMMRCPPLMGAAPTYRDDPGHVSECAGFNAGVLRRVAGDSQVKMVALEAFWESSISAKDLLATGSSAVEGESSDELFRASLERTIDGLQRAGKQVVVFGDVPTFTVDPLWRMRSSQIAGRRWLLRVLQHDRSEVDSGIDQADDSEVLERARELVRQTAAERPGVVYWDMRPQLCEAGMCRYAWGETPLYIDENHVGLRGGEMALRGWVPARL